MRLWRITGDRESYLNRHIIANEYGDRNSNLFVRQIPALTYYLQWTLVGLAIVVVPPWKLASSLGTRSSCERG